MIIHELNLQERFLTFSDGKQVLDVLEEYLNTLSLIDYDPAIKKPMQPISILILDINMPVMDGMECVEKTKTLFSAFNEKACM